MGPRNGQAYFLGPVISDAEYKQALDKGRNFLMARGASREDAEDAVQDAALSAVSTAHPWDGRSKFTTWFFRIVINARLMQIRNRDYQAFANPEPISPDMRVSDVSAEDEIIREEQLGNLAHAMEALTPMQRQTMKMYCCGIKSKEAATLLGIQNSTVKSRIHQSRKTIRQCFSPQH